MSGGVDVAMVSSVLEEILRVSGRPILLGERRLAPDSAAAADGLLPLFLVAGEALWRELMGEGFGLEIERDEGALRGYRVKRIGAASFTAVMLSMMEATAQVAREEGLRIEELSRVWREAAERIGAAAPAKGEGQ